MLHNISWSAYCLTILIVLLGYYTFVFLKYFKAELNNIASGRHNMFTRAKGHNASFFNNCEKQNITNKQPNSQDLFLFVNQFVEDIKYTIEQAAQNNLIKQEVIYSLQQLAKKYFQIKDSPFQSFITNYILVESSNHSSIHLSEEDLNALWVI